MDLPHFKEIVHHVAQTSRARIVAVHEASITPNFFAAELFAQDAGNSVFLLCSLDDYWAISSIFEPSGCELEFIDVPKISEALQYLFGLPTLLARDLTAPVDVKSSPSSDVNYWIPETEGQRLFNWWD
jgi:hypothetical protein